VLGALQIGAIRLSIWWRTGLCPARSVTACSLTRWLRDGDGALGRAQRNTADVAV
jgi:hypothetical protein